MSTLRARLSGSGANARVIPLVKYTNFGDSERINSKLRSYLYQREKDDDERYITRKIGQGVVKSTKKTYQAIAQDFSLADY